MEPESRSCARYRSLTDPDWPKPSTPRLTAGTPRAEPSQLSVCEAASCTVTIGARSAKDLPRKAERSAPGMDGTVAVRTPWRSVRCQAR